MNKDGLFLNETFDLAAKAKGYTSPNPLVGAVLVKHGKVIGRGYHKKAGQPHAEIEAIRNARRSLRGATLYVNLEPCCHWGKTPPCVEQVIASGIKKVVIATKDPNPKVSGRSVRRLRNAGIEVVVGIEREKAEKLNEVFFMNMRKHRPFVVAKAAQSLDGKIATARGQSKWITSDASRTYARTLRDTYDAVLVGINTVLKDNPTLNGIRKIPYKVVIDPRLRISLKAALVTKSSKKLIVFYRSRIDKKKKAQLEKKGARLFPFSDCKSIVKTLYREGITSVFIEGGSDTVGRFFDKKLVDKIYFFYAPKILGGKDALTSIGGKGVSKIGETIAIKDMDIERIGHDLLINGYPKYC
ncbi:MAG: bifunctional diaminohydroxyphosphoribosylaminopyrimidine deaminase/5-amino-6-(5-phosphoribosylamino)uracil reductase RibD [Candidatus Omnitrophica bacterium]|nr:bifunctional diaminohydroxyphosphoribosylaminopyrimidine deaminase/5-amino-6-(5-phosphoribosylamino)uracil reductase RibD [Candidatus Omnitrophota bacterium]